MYDAPFDIYLLDIVMPDMNGIELGRQIRQTHRDGSILYLTSSPDFALESYQAKAYSYLLKPVNQDELLAALDNAIAPHTRRWKNSIIVKTHGGSTRLLLDDILYAKLQNRNIRYYLRSSSVNSRPSPLPSVRLCPPAQRVDRLLIGRRNRCMLNLLDISTIWDVFHVMVLNAPLYEPRALFHQQGLHEAEQQKQLSLMQSTILQQRIEQISRADQKLPFSVMTWATVFTPWTLCWKRAALMRPGITSVPPAIC